MKSRLVTSSHVCVRENLVARWMMVVLVHKNWEAARRQVCVWAVCSVCRANGRGWEVAGEGPKACL